MKNKYILVEIKIKGFTLIELLIVISIIAVLMSVIMPAMRKAKEQAKLALCANNQRQVIIGITAYHSDYGDFPPSIFELEVANAPTKAMNAWTFPSRLNYWPKHVVDSTNPTKGYVGYYLASYITEGYIFNCPFANWAENTTYINYKGEPTTYTELYRTGDSQYLYSSYNLLWNYYGYDWDNNGIRFAGPGRNSKNTLAVFDTILYDDQAANKTKTWQVTHPFKGGTKNKSTLFYELYDPTEDASRLNCKINAGYTDGSVHSFSPAETVRVRAIRYNSCFQRMPNKFK